MSEPEEGRKEYGNPNFVLQQEQTSPAGPSQPHQDLRRVWTQSYHWESGRGGYRSFFAANHQSFYQRCFICSSTLQMGKYTTVGSWFLWLGSKKVCLYWMNRLLSHHLPAAILLGSLCGAALLHPCLCIPAQIQPGYSSVAGHNIKDSAQGLWGSINCWVPLACGHSVLHRTNPAPPGV